MAIPNISPDHAPGGYGAQAYNELGRARNALARESIENEFLRPMSQANLEGKQLTNKFLPLEMGIKAQNAMVNQNRFGEVGQYLRAYGAMPATEKLLYMENPQNAAFHQQMMRDWQEGIKDPRNKGALQSILTPEYVNSFGIGAQTMPQQGGNPLAQGQQPSSQNPLAPGFPGAMPQMPQQQNPMAPQGAPIPPQGQITPEQIQQLQNYPGLETQVPGQQPNTPQQAEKAALDKARLENDQLARQVELNKKQAPRQASERAASAIVLDSWLYENRDQIKRSILNMSKYSGFYNKGQQGLDMLKHSDPEAYKDLIWVKESFIPNLVTQIKTMEKVSGTDQMRQELHGLVGAFDKLSLNPKESLELFDKQINTIDDISRSITNAAEPYKKGTFRKAAGLPVERSAFLTQKEIDETVAAWKRGETATGRKQDLQGKIPKGHIAVINTNGKKGYIPEGEWEKAKLEGYKRG